MDDISQRKASIAARRSRLSPTRQLLLEKQLRGESTDDSRGIFSAWQGDGPAVPLCRGLRRPFFCVHPASGLVFCYAALARHVGPDRPFYGLQSHGLDQGQSPLTRIEDMAALYITAIRKIQPNGPYLLGGWSMGGVVAFEIAQQLLAQQQEVALLVLLDTKAPSGRGAKADELGLLYGFAYDLGVPDDCLTLSKSALQNLSQIERETYILSKAQEANKVPAEIRIDEFRSLYQVFKTNIQAMHSYIPRAYPGRITIIRAQAGVKAPAAGAKRILRHFRALEWVRLLRPSSSTTLGWDRWTAKGVEIHALPGSHHTMISEPHVRFLAERLKGCIIHVEEREL